MILTVAGKQCWTVQLNPFTDQKDASQNPGIPDGGVAGRSVKTLHGFRRHSLTRFEGPMKSKASVRPSKASGIVLLIIAPLFLVFGVALCGAAEGEARPFAMIFLLIWIVICGSMIVYAFSIVFSKRPPALTEIDIEDTKTDNFGSGIDFESKLRKLESLRKDGLISGEEYSAKRSEIMKEKW